MDLGEKIYSWIYEHHKHLGISRGRGGDAIENEEQVTLYWQRVGSLSTVVCW